jgi:hypothetical protein
LITTTVLKTVSVFQLSFDIRLIWFARSQMEYHKVEGMIELDIKKYIDK